MDTWTFFTSVSSEHWFERRYLFSETGYAGGEERIWFIGSGIFANHFVRLRPPSRSPPPPLSTHQPPYASLPPSLPPPPPPFGPWQWFLPGLFFSRIALGVLAPLGTRGLLLASAICTALIRDGDAGEWPLSHTFSYFPVFVLGFLCKRHGHVDNFLAAVRQRPQLLRGLSATVGVVCLLCTLIFQDPPHRLLFRCFCGLQPRGLFTPSLLSVCWVKLWNVVYAFGFTGWLPIEDHGWLTAMGTRTLTNYLVCRMPILLLGKFGECAIGDYAAPKFGDLSPGAFWVLCYLLLPPLTLAFCSAHLTFALWPLVQPQPWAGPLIGLPRGPDV